MLCCGICYVIYVKQGRVEVVNLLWRGLCFLSFLDDPDLWNQTLEAEDLLEAFAKTEASASNAVNVPHLNRGSHNSSTGQSSSSHSRHQVTHDAAVGVAKKRRLDSDITRDKKAI